jgi:hypothetical protein
VDLLPILRIDLSNLQLSFLLSYYSPRRNESASRGRGQSSRRGRPRSSWPPRVRHRSRSPVKRPPSPTAENSINQSMIHSNYSSVEQKAKELLLEKLKNVNVSTLAMLVTALEGQKAAPPTPPPTASETNVLPYPSTPTPKEYPQKQPEIPPFPGSLLFFKFFDTFSKFQKHASRRPPCSRPKNYYSQ